MRLLLCSVTRITCYGGGVAVRVLFCFSADVLKLQRTNHCQSSPEQDISLLRCLSTIVVAQLWKTKVGHCYLKTYNQKKKWSRCKAFLLKSTFSGVIFHTREKQTPVIAKDECKWQHWLIFERCESGLLMNAEAENKLLKSVGLFWNHRDVFHVVSNPYLLGV